MGRPYEDAIVLRVAAAHEGATTWFGPTPDAMSPPLDSHCASSRLLHEELPREVRKHLMAVVRDPECLA